jgi:UDP-glucose 4-epimerase
MELSGKRIMLIGGAGLVGSHIVDQLTAEPVKEIVVFDNFIRGTRVNLSEASASPKVRVVEASMTDRDALKRELNGIDGVFLLASLWLGECVNDPRQAWEVNTLGTWNVVEACRDAGIKRIVYSSSASVYGNAVVTPMTEDHPFNNRTTYGATKIANEQMLRAIYEQHQLPYVGMRYMNIYGPRMDYEGTYVSVIMKVLDKIFANERPVVFGDGSQVYDFIHVADVARAWSCACADV